MYCADIGMADAAGELDLMTETAGKILRQGNVGAKHFDSYVLVQDSVVSVIHGTHAAPAEPLCNFVPRRDERATPDTRSAEWLIAREADDCLWIVMLLTRG